jgi:hypothetical protein
LNPVPKKAVIAAVPPGFSDSGAGPANARLRVPRTAADATKVALNRRFSSPNIG